MDWLQTCTTGDETGLCDDGNVDLGEVDHIELAESDERSRKRKVRAAKRALKRSKEAAEGAATQERLRLLEELCWERFEADDDDDGDAVVAPLFEESFKPIDRLYEIADESFYFRVQCMLLYAPLSLDTLVCLVTCLAAMVLQIACLQTVWQSTWQTYYVSAVGAGDMADAFGGGIPYPLDWSALLREEDVDNTKVGGVVAMVAVPLLMCAILVVMSAKQEMVQVQAGLLLVRCELAELAGLGPRAALGRGVRVALAGVIGLVRVSLVW